jgi:L-alanine-DL-glutamate epimerase-like enolase superfamily enzyme
MADEAVFTPDELEEALAIEAIDVLSIYPGKNGGFTRSIAMAKRAEEAGVACAIGSNLESDLGQAPHVCLASSMKAFTVDRFACDLMGALFYAKSAVTPPLVFDHGFVARPTGVGFGVTPNV